MTILCATHFSHSSVNAVAVAALLARQSHDRLYLTTVVPSRLSHGPRAKAVDLALHREADALRQQGLEVETILLRGEGLGPITRQCQKVGAELLVMEEASWKRDVGRLAARAPVPMLVVRSQEPFEAWAKGTRPLKVRLDIESTEAGQAWISRMERYGQLEVVPSGASDVVVLGAPLQHRMQLHRATVPHAALVEAPMSMAVLPAVKARRPTLFAHQQRGALSLAAVLAVAAAWVMGTAVMLRVYSDGGVQGTCQMVCK